MAGFVRTTRIPPGWKGIIVHAVALGCHAPVTLYQIQKMIERTTDYRIVNKLAPWRVVVSRKVFYLLEKAGDSIKGLWTLEPYKDGLRIHADLGEEFRGQSAIDSAKFAFDWIFRNTRFNKIYAGIPGKNKPACLVASLAGMRYLEQDMENRWYQLSKGW